ncbi:MAG: hypothetical protein OXH14_03230 [Alphaproteobacteria bacterium]|nr:hypothetical protein [Alphaproteobacteria bacterium]
MAETTLQGAVIADVEDLGEAAPSAAQTEVEVTSYQVGGSTGGAADATRYRTLDASGSYEWTPTYQLGGVTIYVLDAPANLELDAGSGYGEPITLSPGLHSFSGFVVTKARLTALSAASSRVQLVGVPR